MIIRSVAYLGSKDGEKEDIDKDCATCFPAGIRVLTYVSVLSGWKLKCGDAKGAFLWDGDAKRDVLMVPP